MDHFSSLIILYFLTILLYLFIESFLSYREYFMRYIMSEIASHSLLIYNEQHSAWPKSKIKLFLFLFSKLKNKNKCTTHTHKKKKITKHNTNNTSFNFLQNVNSFRQAGLLYFIQRHERPGVRPAFSFLFNGRAESAHSSERLVPAADVCGKCRGCEANRLESSGRMRTPRSRRFILYTIL